MVGFLTLVGKGMLDYKIGQREREWESMQELMKFKREQEGRMKLATFKQELKNKQKTDENTLNLIPSLDINRYDMIGGVKTENPMWKFGNFEINPNLAEGDRVREGLTQFDTTIFGNEENTQQFLNMYSKDENFAKSFKSKLEGFAADGKLLNVRYSATDNSAIISALDYSRVMPGLFGLEHFDKWYRNDLWDKGEYTLLGSNNKKVWEQESSITSDDGITTRTYKNMNIIAPPSNSGTKMDPTKPIWNVVPLKDSDVVGGQYIDPMASVDYNRANGMAFISANLKALDDGITITPEGIMTAAIRKLPSRDVYNYTSAITKQKIRVPEYKKNRDPSSTDRTKGSQIYTGGTEVAMLTNTLLKTISVLDKDGTPTGGIMQGAFTLYKGIVGTGGQFDQLRSLAERLGENAWSGVFIDGKGNRIVQQQSFPDDEGIVKAGRKRYQDHLNEIDTHVRAARGYQRENRQQDYQDAMNLAQLKTMQTILAYRLAVIIQGGEGGRTVSDADFAKALEMVGAGDNWTTTKYITGRLKTVGGYAQIAIVQGYGMKQFGGSYKYRQAEQFFTDLGNTLAKRYNPHFAGMNSINDPIDAWWNPGDNFGERQYGPKKSKLPLKLVNPFDEGLTKEKPSITDKPDTKDKPLFKPGGGY